ncbi:MAG TPA: acetyl-CoA acetyltransferase [Syntrophomonas sp.]|jgi:acetyl-CoA acetyltransferase|nr:acetyl-CoA acetyltransferase [Syntrophomonas sp.]HCF70688.1 acetyl-CoA acetyltransferase [Syntrophomonas sp.]
MNISGKAAITGIGELKPMKKAGGRSTLELLAEAAALALRDSDLSKKDIDGLLVAPPSEDTSFMWPAQVAEYLQLYPDYLNVVELGGASAAGAVARAAAAVACGLCSNCLCLAGGIWDTQVFNDMEGKMAVMSRAEVDFDLPYGPMGFNSGYALAARRHMHEFGTKPEQLAKIAVDQRINALANPDALFKEPLTIEEVLRSPLIVDPIHLLEIVRPCSGAGAVIVSRAEQARDCPYRPVFIQGMGESCTHNSIVYAPSLTTSPVHRAAVNCYQMAGAGPRDIDLVSLYDCYTITVLITLEDAGFCSKGEGGAFVENTDLTYKGSLPCNTHGGQLSCGQTSFAGGMGQK